MLNVHVVVSWDQKAQEAANERVLRALLDTKTWSVGLVTASANEHGDQKYYRDWAQHLSQFLRESGIRVNVCGASRSLCPQTQFMTEQMVAIETARKRRVAQGLTDPNQPQDPTECEPNHTLGVMRRVSGECDTVVAIYGRDEILTGLATRNIRISPEILVPGTVVVERDHAEFMIY